MKGSELLTPLIATLTVVCAVLAVLVAGAVIDGRRHGSRLRVTPGAGTSRATKVFSLWTGQDASSTGNATLDESGLSMAPPPGGRDQRADSRGIDIAAGAADATIIAGHDFLSVDPAVFQAATQAAHAPIDNVLDLSTVAHLDSWADASAGAQHALSGHVGEFIAAGHLHDAGLTVHMADTANQQGWDATLGSLHVNFKDYADFHSPGIAAHFAANPDVPIVMPGDTAHLPPDAFHIHPADHLDPTQLAEHKVIVLDAWQHNDASTAMQHAYDQLDPGIALHHAADALAGGDLADAAGAIDLGFPVVTALMAGVREGRLLFDGNTDAARAAKNIALDVGGVAGGGSAGHLIGAGIGMAVGGPPGAVIGGLLGGLLGGVGGKVAATQVRTAPLRSASADYTNARERLVAAAQDAEQYAGGSWRKTFAAVDREYRTALDELVTLYDGFRDVQRDRAEAASTFTAQTAEAALGRARLGADAVEALPTRPPRVFAARGLRAVRRAAAVHQLRRDLARWDAQCRAAASNPNRDVVLDLLAAVPGGAREITDFVHGGITARAEAYKAVTVAAAQTQGAAIGLRAAGQERLTRAWQALQVDVDARLAAPRDELAKAQETLNKELRAAGKDAIGSASP